MTNKPNIIQNAGTTASKRRLECKNAIRVTVKNPYCLRALDGQTDRQTSDLVRFLPRAAAALRRGTASA